MNKEKRLPATARGFLTVVGVMADVTKIALEFSLGIGIILDPVFISPMTWMIFWITLTHNGVPMFSGRRGWMGWTTVAVGVTPVVDALPNWTTYALSL